MCGAQVSAPDGTRARLVSASEDGTSCPRARHAYVIWHIPFGLESMLSYVGCYDEATDTGIDHRNRCLTMETAGMLHRPRVRHCGRLLRFPD